MKKDMVTPQNATVEEVEVAELEDSGVVDVDDVELDLI